MKDTFRALTYGISVHERHILNETNSIVLQSNDNIFTYCPPEHHYTALTSFPLSKKKKKIYIS